MLWSPSSRAFFDSQFSGDLPADVVELTDMQHASLLEGQSQGLLIDLGPSGLPELKERPAFSPSTAQRVSQIKTDLLRIDSDGARPAREIALALAAGENAPLAAVSKLQTLESEAKTLRTELAALSEVG